MFDRCYRRLAVPVKDIRLLRDAGIAAGELLFCDATVAELVWDSVSAGVFPQLEAAAKAGATFAAWNAGAEIFDAGICVGLRGRLFQTDADVSGTPVVPVGEDGCVSDEVLAAAREFNVAYREVFDLLGGRGGPMGG